MDPQVLTHEHWTQIGSLMVNLVLWVGLMVNGAMAFLLGHGVIPSLAMTGEMPDEFQGWRRILYPVSALSLALTLYSLWQAIALIVSVLQYFYPRFNY